MDHMTLRYEGLFNDAITGRITALLDDVLAENHFPYGERNRLKALVVEQVQNIQRYSSHSRQGTLEVGNEADRLFVETRNPIDPDAQAGLKARLDDLNQADPTTLRARFRQEIRRPLQEAEQGAGLGFLFLAQKSARPLSYRFIEGGDLYFQLKSYL